jgi:hypothetical protein
MEQPIPLKMRIFAASWRRITPGIALSKQPLMGLYKRVLDIPDNNLTN